MTVEQTLQRLQAAEVRRVAITELQTDDSLQPRELRAVPFARQRSVETRGEEHIGTLRLSLEAANSVELEPLLVAEIDGGLFVVDGHHRLKAYQRAQREIVPVRVVPMEHRRAVMVSKLVNCEARALEMHPEQRKDAAWQYLAHVTCQGAVGLPAGESLRTVAGRFGVGYGTAQRMLRRLPKVNPKEYPEAAHDPGTGFPRWRHVREAGAGWRDMESKMTPEQITRREAEKAARKLGDLIDKTSPEGWRLALEILVSEGRQKARIAEDREFLAEIAEPVTGDF